LLKTEIKRLSLAICFFTRIPVPRIEGFNHTLMKQSFRYLPLVGLIIGMIGWGAYSLGKFYFNHEIAVALTLISGYMATGAFHEDGWADFWDGFGGGNDKEKILGIMADSRLGTYGALALISNVLIKFLLLKELILIAGPLVIVGGHIISRLLSGILAYDLPYISKNQNSKAGFLLSDTGITSLVILILVGVIVMANPYLYRFSISIPFLILAYILIRLFFKKHLGGVTGDCLGAAQQLFEIMFYTILLLNPWKFI